MRISSTLFFQTGLNSINAQQSDLLHLYQQIGSGQRMVTPSDDPLAAAQAINISQAQSMNKRFGDNREIAMRNLGTEENALTSVTLLLQDIKTRLVEVGNGTLSDADRATLSSVLSSARSSLLSLANSTDGSGQYLFSGAKGGTEPFQQDVDGKIIYKGDAGQRQIQADQTRQIAGSDIGTDVFSRAASGTSDYLSRAVTPPAHVGTGVMSKPRIADPAGANIGNRFAITFTSATEYTVSVIDPLGKVQTGASQPYTPGESTSLALPGGVQVAFSGAPAMGDSFMVEPASSAAFVADKASANIGNGSIGSPRLYDYSLAQDGNTFEITFTGPDKFDVVVKNSLGVEIQREEEKSFTPGRENILQLPSGMEVKISGNPELGDVFTINPASTSPVFVPVFLASKGTANGVASISSPQLSTPTDIHAGETIEITFTDLDKYDVVVKDSLGNIIDATVIGATFIPGTDNVLTLPHDMEVTISGDPAIGDTFTIKPAPPSAPGSLNIFDTLDGIIKSLEIPLSNGAANAAFQNQLATAMQRIDVNYNNVLTVRSSVGSRMNELESLNANGNLRALSYSAALTKMEDLDYYGATAQLQLRTAALEAAALAFKKIQATSLFNMKG